MITKFDYGFENGKVKRQPSYTFTPYEDLKQRLNGISNHDIIVNLVNQTLKGETEKKLIGVEDTWYKIQVPIQEMDVEREKLQKILKNGKNGRPLTSEEQKRIKSKIAELSEGSIVIEKEFYDHYTRTTYKVKEEIQTPYTKLLEQRNNLEGDYPYLKGYRGIVDAPQRPQLKIDPELEKEIKKLMVRQQINVNVGDDKDLIADASKALLSVIKKLNGEELNDADKLNLQKFENRQNEIEQILNNNYYSK
jgi:hypothetical protein